MAGAKRTTTVTSAALNVPNVMDAAADMSSASAKRTTEKLTADGERFVDLLVAYNGQSFPPEERRRIVASYVNAGRMADKILEDMLDKDWLRYWSPDRFDA
jgi:nitrogen fixation/metabolism regulation signal transduction histidine kinase